MSFAWSDFLDLADRLLTHDDEAARRTAVSRAYYAAFHAARRRRNLDAQHSTSRPVGHQELWDYYKNTTATRSLGVHGERLLKRRKSADYDMSPSWDLRNAQEAVNDARRLLRALDPS